MTSEAHLSGRLIVQQLKDARISHIISVPDLTTSDGVLRPLSVDKDIKLVRICREEEGVGICAGLIFAGRRPAMLIQYTGFLASMNAIRAVGLEYNQPICMLVGLLFADSPYDPTRSNNLGVRKMIPILQVMGINYQLVPDNEQAAKISAGLDRAFESSQPAVFLISQYPGV